MEEYYYYYIPQPPFLLVGLGLFIALTSGFAFQSTLKLKARGIVANNDDIRKQLSTIDLQLPLFGIGMGMSIFLASGLEVFFIPAWFAYSLSLPLTIGTVGLLWKQLERVFAILREGGSKALEVDSFNIF
ncbi:MULTISPECIES: hypothetical protein [Cyanophyceae]|uniref:hypothetical protein n=1 Tax=Cyanophyceae TaxID=3028117 RepID=UPI0004AACB85|nr:MULTISPECIES: hypothetical protein [Cyanophyceae]AMA10105.1 hypothetical protein AWQ23_12695 [Picosynechococcus sp. PCC 73109]ANV88271.1 hypothetical protein AWQ22_12820 [Picosynechococcus sp. PCC 7117]QCS48372.1 hypothetical protein FEK30_02365 [Picosynechococcus sp. PCC 11901]